MQIQKAIWPQLLLVVLAGCHAPIKVEPLEFHHADEVRQEGDFMVLADRRVFAVMAFLNVCGFDEEVAGKEMHPVRKKVTRCSTGPCGSAS